ncbi:hypothetical protein RB25_11570 [Herbaspirillum rubrisubalbicans]|nr:hypothetical protein RB25_11570 [Herbaspirillum rubrisubalbicans]
MLAISCILTPALTCAAPTGGIVSSGTLGAPITTAGNTTTITQSSNKLVINWNNFSVGTSENVNFVQPDRTAIALNRVIGQDPSRILGNLNANGQVFILNPNGVLFGSNAQVNVGGLVASTQSLSDSDFMNGNYRFSGQSGSVVNQGRLNATDGGYIALLAPEVRNEGVITARLGTAMLGAGKKISLNLDNGSLIGYSIDQGTLNALVENKLLIQADGGTVILSAKAADGLSTAVINNTGIVEARGIREQGGVIRLEADVITQSGNLDASAAGSNNGGHILMNGRSIVDTGSTSVSGANGGSISVKATDALIQTSSANMQASGDVGGVGGSISLDGGNSLFSSATLSTKGLQGGLVSLLGQQVTLVASSVDVSGNAAGGNIRIGGDNPAGEQALNNADHVLLNGATTLKAEGRNSSVGIWSKRETDFYGAIDTGPVGNVEISSQGTVVSGGTVNAGNGGRLLIDPTNIIITNNAGPAAFSILDPHPTAGDNFGGNIALLGSTVGGVFLANGNLAVGVANDNLGGSNAGISYVFNTTTGALLSAVIGTHAGDAISSNGFTVLNNGNYLIKSGNWNNNAGAVTWANGRTGISGVISSANSLVGSNPGDGVGSASITLLSNNNYLINTPGWNGSAGAVTWGNGSTGTSGVVSSLNSVVGSNAGDTVGGNGITLLSNGNYVINSPNWNGGIGAVTWGNAGSGSVGVVSSANSLVGSNAGDTVGSNGVTALNNGNYVVDSSAWNNNIGAVTWGNGNVGSAGVVSAGNSLVGTSAFDAVGDRGVTALSNGNYVVVSSSWNNLMGAVTWGDGRRGTTGVVAASNSLVGSNSGDSVGGNGVTALTNGNYVIASSSWNNSTGAVTWANGSSGINGTITSGNSLIGSNTGDSVGGTGVTALSNGNYVVDSSLWNNVTGAVTWANGSGGIAGTISASNSLIGSSIGDMVGDHGVTALSNGNYLVSSGSWNNLTGAVTWGNGATGINGVVSSGNSLVGSNSGDMIGNLGITVLRNGNYLVSSSAWNNNAGAVTWGNGRSGTSGAISSANSLVGSNGGDMVGSNGITLLGNGNYVVVSSQWNNSAGAVTLGNGNSGTSGVVSSANSLVGSNANDLVGNGGITLLKTGDYVVNSAGWNQNRGAVTWSSATAGRTGAVSASNSLIGSSSGDAIGLNGITAMSDGNYLVNSASWNNGTGAVTWASGNGGVSGTVSAANSLVGSSVGDAVGASAAIDLHNGNYLLGSPNYAGGNGQILVGTPHDISFATGSASNPTMSLNPSGLSATLATGTNVTLQASNDITVDADIMVDGSHGGNLTLQAGHQLTLNSVITTANGDFTGTAGDPGALASVIDPGTAAIMLGNGAAINAGSGKVTLAAYHGNFYNYSGSSTPIRASQWSIYSTDPSRNVLGGMRANIAYIQRYLAGKVPRYATTGNWFFYSEVEPLSFLLGDVTADLTLAITAMEDGQRLLATYNQLRASLNSARDPGASSNVATNNQLIDSTTHQLSLPLLQASANGTTAAISPWFRMISEGIRLPDGISDSTLSH